MRISVSVDDAQLVRLVQRFPNASAKALRDFTDRVGFKVEREAKVEAPVVTGNLRRQIRFINSAGVAGVVKSFANYSGFVHGHPYHQNRRKRRETPFLTMAMGNSATFIEQERRKIIGNIIKDI
jgi:hypothetical protein